MIKSLVINSYVLINVKVPALSMIFVPKVSNHYNSSLGWCIFGEYTPWNIVRLPKIPMRENWIIATKLYSALSIQDLQDAIIFRDYTQVGIEQHEQWNHWKQQVRITLHPKQYDSMVPNCMCCRRATLHAVRLTLQSIRLCTDDRLHCSTGSANRNHNAMISV